MDAGNSAAAETMERELVVTRVFDAPRSLVWKAWAEPDRVVDWYGPRGFTITFCEMDVRPRGTYRICMRSPEGTDHWVRGVYREIVPPARLAFTWAWEDAEGKPQHETLVTVSLVERGARTELTLRHSGFESDTARDEHRTGWTECLDEFPDYLATAAA
jgi:uncharacterized protein YndB with AHSA1/START domain